MKVKKKYTLKNKRTIWRLIPSGNKLLVEERDEVSKQVYYNCVAIESGKSILKNFQPEDKFWSGIEAFEDDRIYFHKFVKPDMPGHIGVTVYDLNAKKILWRKDNFVFLFLNENKVFTFVQKFESREFFSLDAETGNIVSQYGENAREINSIREKLLDEQYEKYKNYYFPESYTEDKSSPEVKGIIESLKQGEIISGTIDIITYQNLLLLSYHTVKDDGKMNNYFIIIEIDGGKVIFKEVINSDITSYIPDSFFIKDNFLFLIKDKSELIVFSLN